MMTPSALVLKRLEDIIASHKSSIAGLTLESNGCHSSNTTTRTSTTNSKRRNNNNNGDANCENFTTTSSSTGTNETSAIFEAALRRSCCSQPPLDGCGGGGGPCNNPVVELDLNPAERVAPHRLLLSNYTSPQQNNDFCDSPKSTSQDMNNDGNATSTLRKIFQLISEPTSTSRSFESMIELSTLKAITALATLCDEAHELEMVAHAKFLPQLTLFGRDLKVFDHSSSNSSLASSEVQSNIAKANTTTSENPPSTLDEEAMAKRDSELLRRISSFIKTLQTIMNFTLRCQRLLRNMVAQLDGCYRPISSWGNNTFNNSIQQDEDEEGENLQQNVIDPSSSTTNPALFGHGTHLMPIGDAISKILGILISIDQVIAHNMELREAWDLYKSVVMDKSEQLQREIQEERTRKRDSLQLPPAGITIDNNTNDDMNDVADDTIKEEKKKKEEEIQDSSSLQEMRQNLELLQRMLYHIDFTLLSSRSYIIAIEQNFDPASNFYNNNLSLEQSKNVEGEYKNNTSTATSSRGGEPVSFSLQEEIKLFVLSNFQRIFSSIVKNTKKSTETNSTILVEGSREIIGTYGMYGLYRRLLPSHLVPDDKLHKSLCLDLPSICPIISLFGDVPFIPAEFLFRYAPLDRKSSVGMSSSGGNHLNSSGKIKTEARVLLEKTDNRFSTSVRRLHEEALFYLFSADAELASSEQEEGGEIVEVFSILPSGDDENPEMYSQTEPRGPRPTAIVEFKMVIILKGLKIARRAMNMLRNYLIMHKILNVPIEPEHIPAIEKLCSIVKSIDMTMTGRRRSSVVCYQQAALKIVSSSIFKRFDTLRMLVDQHSASINRVCSVSDKIKLARFGASLSTLESLLKGSSTFSPARRFAIETLICACGDDGNDGDGESLNFDGAIQVSDYLFNQLRLISDLDDNMKEAFDCSFLYFYKGILPSLLQQIYRSSRQLESPRLQPVLSAFSDPCNNLLSSSKYFEACQRYRTFIDEALHKDLLIPLCECIENNLRLHVYAKNIEEMKPPNPRKEKIEHVLWFLEMPLLHVCGTSLDIKSYVQRHLESSFYNFSTIGLQDSQAYVEMSVLAKEMYGLVLVDNCLPAGSVEQGIDLMMIAKDIDSFTSTYNYNINQQNFVERRPQDGCHYLNTVSIENISFSLKRHGIGIAGTTSHVVYQFLSKTFQSFSKLLLGDFFRSTLSKEKRWFDQQRSAQLVPYPVDRAIFLSKDIANIGMTNEGFSTLEHCRNLVTLIGNVLGLARLVQSGKMNVKNQVMQYFTTMQSSGLNSSSDDNGSVTNIFDKAACQNSTKVPIISEDDDHIEKIRSIFTSDNPENDVLQVVLNVFKNVISDSDHTHMDYFFLLIPALCLCWLESSLKGKSMVNKTFRTYDAFYTDDGFAMGVAFLLAILEQHDKFDSLDWFEVFLSKYRMERNNVLLQITKDKRALESIVSAKQKSTPLFSFESQNSKPSEENDETTIKSELIRLKVIAKRLDLRTKEMEMLYYSTRGARFFFRT